MHYLESRTEMWSARDNEKKKTCSSTKRHRIWNAISHICRNAISKASSHGRRCSVIWQYLRESIAKQRWYKYFESSGERKRTREKSTHKTKQKHTNEKSTWIASKVNDQIELKTNAFNKGNDQLSIFTWIYMRFFSCVLFNHTNDWIIDSKAFDISSFRSWSRAIR